MTQSFIDLQYSDCGYITLVDGSSAHSMIGWADLKVFTPQNTILQIPFVGVDGQLQYQYVAGSIYLGSLSALYYFIAECLNGTVQTRRYKCLIQGEGGKLHDSADKRRY